MSDEHEASCSCGALRLRATGEPVRVSICHCLACQQRTGSVFGAQARFARSAVTTTGTPSRWRRTSDDGGTTTFSFCPECGSTVFYEYDDDDEVVAVPVGAFADPSFPAPTRSVWEERRHAWVVVPDGATRER